MYIITAILLQEKEATFYIFTKMNITFLNILPIRYKNKLSGTQVAKPWSAL